MSKKSCPKSVPGLTNMPKNTRKVKTQHGIGQTLSSILSPNGAWALRVLIQQRSLFLGFLPSVLSISAMETFSRKPPTTSTFKTFKQMFFHTCFTPCIFPIIVFVIAPSTTEFIGGFPE